MNYRELDRKTSNPWHITEFNLASSTQTGLEEKIKSTIHKEDMCEILYGYGFGEFAANIKIIDAQGDYSNEEINEAGLFISAGSSYENAVDNLKSHASYPLGSIIHVKEFEHHPDEDESSRWLIWAVVQSEVE